MPANTVVASHPAPPALMSQQLIRQYYLPLAERTFWRWVSAGQFPRPDLCIGGKVRYWRRETVEQWIDVQAGKGVTP